MRKVWSEYIFTLKDKITLNHEVISEAVTAFFENHVSKINDDEHVFVLFRIPGFARYR